MVVCGVAFSRFRFIGIVAGVTLALAATAADARPKKKKRAPAYTPPYAAMVVDANSGRVLHASNENALRHPASITKVMTLYLLFEQMERGRFRLDTPIPISARAASMPPTKLGLRAGSTITVENAIGSLVTKSANDIAVAVAEAIGGDEANFAQLMTRKAQSIGMTRTVFRNASGLPNVEQVTTARDLTILGRAIQERFPRQFAYFAKTEHRMGPVVMRSHNRLLGRLEYVDGIKTGFIRASGFNVLTSAKLDGRRVVAVVMGGRTASHRDGIMANLVESTIEQGARARTAPMIAEAPVTERVAEAFGVAPAPIAAPAPRQAVTAAQPALLVPLEAPAEPIGRPIALASSYAPVDSARPAVVTATSRDNSTTASIRSATPNTISGDRRAVAASSTPSTLRWVSGARGIVQAGRPADSNQLTPPAAIPSAPAQKVATRAESIHTATAPMAAISSAAAAQSSARQELVAAARPVATRTGVMIQIGATDDQGKAQELLARARSQTRSLASAQPFTEKVQRGRDTLWRARFAGLNEGEAESACKALKRSGFACFTTRN
ncbi:MAG: D-alanyl-D-alanine carboxypeptidase [Beijerinckiaceae bacterium]|nr:D-alanyl-D-alanine carboxypeptidase [Beijerinckiaceae bacterium]